MKKQIYHVDFPLFNRGSDKNFRKCLSLLHDHFKYTLKEDYKVGFHSRFDWRHFPTWFSLYNKHTKFDCFFYKEKAGAQILKVEMNQIGDELATSVFKYITINKTEV